MLDWEFFDTKIVAHKWNEANFAGPLTQAHWNACLAETIAHEKRHREHFKSCVLEVVKPQKFIINVCSHNNQIEYLNKPETIRIENKKMKDAASVILNNVIIANQAAAKKNDANDNGPFMRGTISVKD